MPLKNTRVVGEIPESDIEQLSAHGTLGEGRIAPEAGMDGSNFGHILLLGRFGRRFAGRWNFQERVTYFVSHHQFCK